MLFFASVEQRNNPCLQKRPIAVGGNPNQRGVVATASYEAREFGIHSAMPMATALRLCPQLIIVSPNISLYREIAEEIRQIFSRFTHKIEILSIDEAYLGVTKSTDCQGSATLIAQNIIKTIKEETNLTASAGVSYCKFLAKYASDINKPNGVYTITPHSALEVIADMPIEKFHGIGPATKSKLNQLGIFTGLDLRNADMKELSQKLGKTADFYYQLSHGKDDRELRTNRIRKSLGSETTFTKDIKDNQLLSEQLNQLVKKSWKQLADKNLSATNITVKVKYSNFKTETRSYTHSNQIDNLDLAGLVAEKLINKMVRDKPIRLIGISYSRLHEKKNVLTQQTLKY